MSTISRAGRISKIGFIGFAGILCWAQTGAAPQLITQPVDDSKLTTLAGNTHSLARAEFDKGVAPANLAMNRMLLVLKRSPEQQTALEQFLREQHDPASPNFHHWLTPEQFGRQFGISDADLAVVTNWLRSQGFEIGNVSNGRMVIEFSGTVAQVQYAFHTAIHKYVVNGESHWANNSDPQIPAALAPAVAGIASLNSFFARPQVMLSGQKFAATVENGAARPQFTGSGGSHALAPADYATIYNINPVYSAGINGSGVVIAVVGRTNINVQDVNSFRSIFGLPSNPPQVVVNGSNPGDLGGGEEAEAVLDTTWSGAVAPNAQVDLVVSASTSTTDGVFLSEEFIIDNNLANVMTESFGDCEANYTAAQAANISAMAQQAAAEGITYMVSAGDAGSAGCDNFNTESSATGPVSVNILASTPYTIAVGGTQFFDDPNPSVYWSSTNGSTLGSALSYIPEDVWNANCYGASCGSYNILAGGGGRSQFFTKPFWQSGVAGIPNDGARDVPDVALAAAGGIPYLICLDGSCTPNSQGQISFEGIYGTSAAAPSFAGIMALINQKAQSRQGQAAPVLYSLASAENLANCNASNTSTLPGPGCVFNDVTIGTNAVPGEPNYNMPSETYAATTGFDLASGLGSVNVANLVNQWPSGSVPPITVYSAGTIPYYADPDPTPVELGVKFRSSEPGYITGVRFYKSSSDTNAHTGSLWSDSGQLLATGTFSSETASGWQTLTFETPVAIAANTTYIASYHTTSGYYGVVNYFANQSIVNGPLTLLQNGTDGGNGVFVYSGGGVFPNQTWESANYWVDVLFTPAPAVSTIAPSVFPQSVTPYYYNPDPTPVELGVKFRSDVPGYITGIRFYKNSSDNTTHVGSLWTDSGTLLARGTFSTGTGSGWQQLNFASPVPISANTTYIASYFTSGGYYGVVNYYANSAVSNNELHQLQNGVDGGNGVYIYTGSPAFPIYTYNAATYWVDIVFSQSTTQPFAGSLFSPATVPVNFTPNTSPVELGVKFRSDVNGHITGIRFYKNSTDTSVHTGSLWSQSGQLLATGTFTNETASGWQTLTFPTPVAITANTTYVASYHTSSSFYGVLNFFQSQGLDNVQLHALQSGLDGPNGVYVYGPGGVFPAQTYYSANYWVDVVFTAP